MSIAVSVVIPTCNRPEMLQRCLAALVAQDLDPSSYEIIVVDDAPNPRTRQVVESFQAQPAYAITLGPAPAPAILEPRSTPFRDSGPSWQADPGTALASSISIGLAINQAGLRPVIVYLAGGYRRGPAAARNLGWWAAMGEVIAFTDDDTIPTPGWLSSGLACFQDGVDGASGRIVVPLPEHPTDYERDVAGLEHSRFVTANCFYRRSALMQVNGFDEKFSMAWREDSDLYFRLLENGHRLVEAPQAVVVHPVRPARWGVSLSQQRKSMYNALMYKKHPRRYRQLQPTPPFQYYAILAALLGMVVGGWAGEPALLAASAGGWAAMSLAFCFRRLRGTSRRAHHVVEMLVTSILIPPLSIYWRLRGAVKFRVFFL